MISAANAEPAAFFPNDYRLIGVDPARDYVFA
jgi:hypothetical protein